VCSSDLANSNISTAVIKGTTNVQDSGYSLTIDGRTAVTMTVAQNALIGSSAGNNNTVTLSNAATATGNAAVESYVLANGDQTFTLGAAGQNLTGGTGNDTINTGNLTGNLTGTLNGGTGTNTFVAADDVNITGANVSNFGTFQVANTKTLTADAEDVSGRSVTGTGTLNIFETTLAASTDLTGVSAGLQFNGATGGTLTLGNAVTLTINQAQLAFMDGIVDGAAQTGMEAPVVTTTSPYALGWVYGDATAAYSWEGFIDDQRLSECVIPSNTVYKLATETP
jgi:hypothetical protein